MLHGAESLYHGEVDSKESAFEMPSWFAKVRAVALLVIGIVMILHETIAQDTPVRVVVIIAAFLLMGFSAADVASLWKREV